VNLGDAPMIVATGWTITWEKEIPPTSAVADTGLKPPGCCDTMYTPLIVGESVAFSLPTWIVDNVGTKEYDNASRQSDKYPPLLLAIPLPKTIGGSVEPT
jgi:hypothetical protein